MYYDMANKKLREDLITPPGEYEDRVLKPRQTRKRVITHCDCGSTRVKLLNKPALYICLSCKRRFVKEKK